MRKNTNKNFIQSGEKASNCRQETLPHAQGKGQVPSRHANNLTTMEMRIDGEFKKMNKDQSPWKVKKDAGYTNKIRYLNMKRDDLE